MNATQKHLNAPFKKNLASGAPQRSINNPVENHYPMQKKVPYRGGIVSVPLTSTANHSIEMEKHQMQSEKGKLP